MRAININGKDYNIDCNSWTYIQFKKVFGTGIFADISIIRDYLIKQTETMIKIKESKNPTESISKYMQEDISEFIEAITRITYIMIYTANDGVLSSYDEWLRSIERIRVDDDWIVEVTEFAVSCFH